MPLKNKSFGDLIDAIPLVKSLLSLEKRTIVPFIVVLVVLFLSGTGAFILGAAIVLPSTIIRLFTQETLLFFSASLATMLIVGWACFSVSRLLVIGLHIFWNFLACKLRYGPKYDRGLRNPILSRYQRRRDRWILESDTGKILLVVSQTILTLVFLFILFLKYEVTAFIVGPFGMWVPAMIFTGFTMALPGILAMYGVGHKISHRDFFSSPEGYRFILACTLLFCVLVGSLKTRAMMRAEAFIHVTEAGECLLAPLFPISGGNLYYEQNSRSFVIFSPGNRAIFLTNRLLPNTALPTC